ncbi:hypothetical protein ZWY2020_046716 [Hordeum vulgare]|nr:hypothetical protein ZWY2020_046716 [Hordeum vulgare]
MGRRGRPRRRPPTPSESSEDEAFMMPIGAEVEVRSDDLGFAGSFYEATVAGHLLSEGRRRAAATDVRPRPPPVEREFAIHEMVEAFHSDGWWDGVVAAVVPPPVTGDRRRRAYRVTFPTSRETLQFQETDLRPRRVFEVGGGSRLQRWTRGILCSVRRQVEVIARNFGESWNPATVLKVIGATQFQVQYIHIGKDDESATEILGSQYIRPAPAITHMDSKYRFSHASHVEVLHEGGWRPGIILDVLGSEINKKYVVNLKNSKTDMDDVEPVDVLTVDNMQLRTQFDWDGKKWARCLKKLSHQNYVHGMHPFQKSSNGPRLTSRKGPIPAFYDDSDKISNRPGSRPDKKLKIEVVISEQDSPVLSIPDEKNKINREQENAALALRSRLSPPSLPPMAAFGSLSSSSLAPCSHLEQSSSKMMIIPSMPQSQHIEGSKNVLSSQDKQSTVGTGTELSRQMEECASSQTAVALGENSETIHPLKGIAAPAKAIEEDMAELPNDVIAGCGTLPKMDTLSCIDAASRKDIGGSQAGNGRHDLEQGATQVKHMIKCGPLLSKSAAVHESIVDRNGRVSEPMANQHLPFVKSSPLWAQVEGLEIFRKTPQRPNFYEFQQHGPVVREFIALCLMLCFAILAVSINKLDFLDSNGILANGFDVKDLRSRVETLLHTNNIQSLAMAVHHLELHACLMRSIMRSAITQRVNNAMEISRLKTEANDLERSYLSIAVYGEFEVSMSACL